MGALGQGMRVNSNTRNEGSAVDVNGYMSGDRGYDPSRPAKKKKQEDATGRVYGDVGYSPTPAAPAPASKPVAKPAAAPKHKSLAGKSVGKFAAAHRAGKAALAAEETARINKERKQAGIRSLGTSRYNGQRKRLLGE